MGASGTAVLDFGAFPGQSDASIAVTGQGGIVSGSLVEAWIRPEATSDHTVDEHMLETLKVFAHTISAGVGFTISGFNTSQLNEPLEFLGTDPINPSGVITFADTSSIPSRGGQGTRIYGQWTIAWVWN